jgi:hypothetical protein
MNVDNGKTVKTKAARNCRKALPILTWTGEKGGP